MAPSHRSDFSAALTGLILGGVVLFAIMFAIVHMTNSHFEGHKAQTKTETAK